MLDMKKLLPFILAAIMLASIGANVYLYQQMNAIKSNFATLSSYHETVNANIAEQKEANEILAKEIEDLKSKLAEFD